MNSTKHIGSDFAGFDAMKHDEVYVFRNKTEECSPLLVFAHVWFEARAAVCIYWNVDMDSVIGEKADDDLCISKGICVLFADTGGKYKSFVVLEEIGIDAARHGDCLQEDDPLPFDEEDLVLAGANGVHVEEVK